MKKILIPTLRFPPAGGVGLRRIIKMGKNMAKDGIEVHYLTTNNNAHVNSYIDDVKDETIKVKKIPSLSLHNYFYKYRSSFFWKVVAKIVYYITLPIYFVDYASLWGIVLIPYAYFYIKKNKITNVYSSGAPFSTLIHMALLKSLMPDVNLICEWRDVWTDDFERVYLPPRNVSRWIQIQMEKFVIRRADYIIGVTNSILNKLVDHDLDREKFILIENGFDMDSFHFSSGEICGNTDIDNSKKVICYAGNIMDDRAEGFFLFLDAIMNYSRDNIVVEMCGELGWAVKSRLKREYSNLTESRTLIHHGVVSTKDAISLIRRSDFCLIVAQRQQPEAVASKFYEYCAAQKPIIALGPCGDLQNKMSENRVGLFCDLDHFSADELYAFVNMKFDGGTFCFDKILQENDFSYLAKKMEMLLK